MMKFYENWQLEVPLDIMENDAITEKNCVQKTLPFGDFFKYYNLNLIVTELGEKDVAIFRISDFEDNKIASKTIDTTRDFCLIHQEGTGAGSKTNRILFNELTITKNVKSLKKDSFTLTIPERGYVYDFDAEKFENNPLMYVDQSQVCLVVGDHIISEYLEVYPVCKHYSLKDIEEQIKHDLETCIAINQETCGCQITLLDHEGLQLEFNNYDGYTNITIRNESKELSPPLKINNFIFDMGGYETLSNLPVLPTVNSPGSDNGGVLRGKLNYFPENIYLGYYNGNYAVRNDFSGDLIKYKEDFTITDNRLIILKEQVPNVYAEEQILTSSQEVESSKIINKWNYFTIANDLKGLTWCK